MKDLKEVAEMTEGGNFWSNVAGVEKKLRGIFPKTPLKKSKFLSEKFGARIFLKREDLTPVRSYKIRGAFHFFSSFLGRASDVDSIKFIGASAGNHAQGFAFCCARFRVAGKIFMPRTTPEQKVEMTRIFGEKFLEVELVGDTFDAANAAAHEYLEAQNKSGKTKNIFVPPFDHPRIIEGQATVGAEILAQWNAKFGKIDMIVLPVGGGGISAGISEYFRKFSPKTEIIPVEPAGAPSLKMSLQAGKRVELEKIDPFVDGAAVKKIGKYNFEILKKNIRHPVLLAPENRICEMMLDFLRREGVIMEPAGALAPDGLKSLDRDKIAGKNIVCLISGGNFDFERLPEIKERAMKNAGTKKYFLLRLPQRPGALREFLGFLGPDDDIARFEYLKKSAKTFGSVLLGIETSDSKNFERLEKKMNQSDFGFLEVSENEILADFLV